MGKRILVIGSTCIDVIIRVEHLPRREEDLHPEGQQFAVGGCAYNVANILGRSGADVRFLTPVGLRGVFGPFLKPILARQPWVWPIWLEDNENGCCYCLVEPDGERTFMSIHGAEYTFSPDWINTLPEGAFDYAYVCGLEVEEATGEKLVSWLEGTRIGTLLYAPGPRGLRVPQARTNRLLSLHPLLHLNRKEALQLGGSEDLQTAIRTLQQKTENEIVVTLGSDGALAVGRAGQAIHIPGVPAIQVKDTIGAGDAHAGALLLGLSRGLSLCDASMLANRTAAEAVQQAGATLSDEALARALKPVL